MTVPKTSVDGHAPRGQPTTEAEGTSPKDGEFDAVLGEKADRRPGKKGAGRGEAGRAEGGARAGSGRGRSGGGEGGATAAPGSESQRIPAREAAAQHALREAEADGTARDGAHGPSGDLTRPVHARWAPSAADAAGATDAAARVERIADQILLAAEVRLRGDGAVEARLQLDLGRLGRMNVALERTAEGQIRVALEPTSAEGRDLLQARGQELAHRLEARGLKLQALTVESAGETMLRIEGGREGTETASTRSPSPGPDSAPADRAAEPELPPQRERSDEDGERRGRREGHESEPSGEEEEA
jgi:hypothetical protein